MDILDIARFWSKAKVGRKEECWEWQSRKNESGHGDFKVDGHSEPAHRVAFRMAVGEIPDGVVIRHTCDNPGCVNPLHLVSGTHADNVRDRVIRNRSAMGENASNTKLTTEQVYEIRSMGWAPLATLATKYGVCSQTIQAIRYRRSWKHLP